MKQGAMGSLECDPEAFALAIVQQYLHEHGHGHGARLPTACLQPGCAPHRAVRWPSTRPPGAPHVARTRAQALATSCTLRREADGRARPA